jgi:hypothetical protein
MILREYQTLPPVHEALQRLQKGESLHLVGLRQEALRALLLGPILSISISFGVLLWMLTAGGSRDSLVFLIGPILGVLASFVWLLYSLRLLQSPRVEPGIHCTHEKLMTFALRDDAPFHEMEWSDCESFLVRDDAIYIKVSPDPKQDSYIDTDFTEEGAVPVNIPSTVNNVNALGEWLEELRQQIARR